MALITGLFDQLATMTWATSNQVAARTGLTERYVRIGFQPNGDGAHVGLGAGDFGARLCFKKVGYCDRCKDGAGTTRNAMSSVKTLNPEKMYSLGAETTYSIDFTFIPSSSQSSRTIASSADSSGSTNPPGRSSFP